MVRRLETSLSVLICVGVGLACKRTLVANGMSTWQQVKIWCLDDCVLHYTAEISLNMMLKHNRQTFFIGVKS